MSSRFRSRYGPFGIGGWTPAVKVLIIACVVTFFLQIIDRMTAGPSFIYKFGLTPTLVVHNFYLWQLVTYIFLHDTNQLDRKSTRLNSSHLGISYAVFCL